MFKIVAIMLCGVMVGYLLRNKSLGFVPRLITIAIWVLLFLLGIAVGLNDAILNNLDTIGLQAFILSIGGIVGSVILAWVVYRFFFSKTEE